MECNQHAFGKSLSQFTGCADEPVVHEAQYNHAQACLALDDFGGASRLYEAIAAAQERSLGGEHAAILRTRMGLVGVLAGAAAAAPSAAEKALAEAKAEGLCRQLERAQRAQLGPRHRDTLRSRMNLASFLAGQVGLGRIVALCCRSSTSHQIH